MDLMGHTTRELEFVAESMGESGFRGRQLAAWIYRKGASSFDEMTDLPAGFRSRLAESSRLGLPRIAHEDIASDGTIKYLLALADGEQVETVYLPYPERVSLCVSSQVGCAAGCTFCATAIGGLARQMTAGEIASQYVVAQSSNPARRISHVVFMGMGEPLMNYDNVLSSIRLLVQEIGLSARHITVSTVGVPSGILRLADESLPITLALSLHAPNDAVRETLIPTARKWKLAEILDACREYYSKTHRNLTFEYLLIGGINDDPAQACEMAKLLEGIPGNVNLIPFNYVETRQGFRRPESDRIHAFRAALEGERRVTTQRVERGHAISAACGQLKRTVGTLKPRKSMIPVAAVGH